MPEVTREQVEQVMRNAPCLNYESRHTHTVMVSWRDHIHCITSALEVLDLWPREAPPHG